MARLILIRHAESVANAERRFTHGPFEPLTPRGRADAELTARALAGRFDPVALYASPFVRALETARLLGRVFGLVPVTIDALREQDFGELHGRPYADYASDPSAVGVGRWSHRPPGGETLEEVARRVGPALERLGERHLGQEILVVSHGAVMAAIRGWCEGRFDRDPVPTRNAGGYVLQFRERRWSEPDPIDLAAPAPARGGERG